MGDYVAFASALPANPLQELALLVHRLSEAPTLPDICSAVTEAARRLVGADGVTFVLRDGDKCFYAEENAIAPLWKGRRFPMADCVSGWVMLNKTPAAIEDIYADPRIPAEAYRETFVKSLAMVPVRSLDPLAAMGAYWQRRHLPTAGELQMLQGIADAAALAIAHLEMRTAKLALEAHSRVQSRYMAAATHDLRQPLQSLFMFLAVLSASSLDERARYVLGQMEVALTGMKDMMEGVLTQARLDAGVCEPRIEAVGLPAVLGPIISAYQPLVLGKGLTFRCQAPDIAVRTDPLLLARMVRNLVDNAMRYTAKGMVSLAVRAGAERVEIDVEDTGTGIAADQLGEIFEEFRRGSAGSQEAAGCGLGLATVHKLSALLDHPVSVTSQPGEGSRFTVSVPRG